MSDGRFDPRFAVLLDFFENRIPFNTFLGIEVREVELGRVVLAVPWRPEFIGDSGRQAIHGGVTSALSDTAGGAACFTLLDNPRDRLSTVDMRVDYLRPGPPAELLCEARVIRMGNRVGVARMEVFSGEVPPLHDEARGDAIATAQGVYNIVRRGG